MSGKFSGTIDELKILIESTGYKGEWKELENGKYQFRSGCGAILNWWKSNKTLQFQGKPEEKAKLEEMLMAAMGDGEVLDSSSSSPHSGVEVANQQIFVVHGHDKEARDQLELALFRLGLQPFILMNTSGGGKTIIEALEGHIGRDFTSAFGIVLMTPDDRGYPIAEGSAKEEPRARQNVILETGMLLSSLTRDRIALLVKGHMEIPSDLLGGYSASLQFRSKGDYSQTCLAHKECRHTY